MQEKTNLDAIERRYSHGIRARDADIQSRRWPVSTFTLCGALPRLLRRCRFLLTLNCMKSTLQYVPEAVMVTIKYNIYHICDPGFLKLM